MSSIQVSWAQFQVPDHCPAVPVNANAPSSSGAACGCGCGGARNGDIPASPAPTCLTCEGVRYGTGEVVLKAKDLDTNGFGVCWGHKRSYASRLTQNTNAGNGNNWQIDQWSYLVFPASGTVVVMGNANDALWFDLVGTTYVPRFNVRQTLLYNLVANVYELIALDGSVTRYNGGSGVFQSRTDPANNRIAVVSYAANGFNLTEVQRTVTVGGTTTVESFLYTVPPPEMPASFGAEIAREIPSSH